MHGRVLHARAGRARGSARRKRRSRRHYAPGRIASRSSAARARSALSRVRPHPESYERDRELRRNRLRRARARARARRAFLSRIHRRHESRPARAGRVLVSRWVGIHVACVVGPRRQRRQTREQPACGSRLRDHGRRRRADVAVRFWAPRGCGWRLRLRRDAQGRGLRPSRDRPRARADRRGLQSRSRAAARVAAARTPRGAKPRFGAHERRDDQGGRVRICANRVRSIGSAVVVVERAGARDRGCDGAARRSARVDGARSEAFARVPHGGEHRDHIHRVGPGARVRGERDGRRRGARAHGRRVPCVQPLPIQEPVVPGVGRDPECDGRAGHGAPGRPDPPDAGHGPDISRRLRRDFRAAAVQRLRVRVAHVSGDPVEPRAHRSGSRGSSFPPSAQPSRARRRSRPPVS